MKKKEGKKKSGKSRGKMILKGIEMAALGAGAYYLLGPNAKAHQKKTAAVLIKIKKDVGGEMRKAKKASAPMYHKIVDKITSNYAKQYNAHEGEIKALNRKLKSEWKDVERLKNNMEKKAAKGLKSLKK